MPRLGDASRASRVEVLATLTVIGIVAGVVVGRDVSRRVGPHPSREQCGALLDRYVEHLVAAEGGPLPTPAHTLEERKAQARAKAALDPEFARCPVALTQSETTCALGAGSADELERCLP